ncbi:MAG TPA: hypothetical protein VHO84_16505, partial [Syntrophorhabdaceae bacterium]|nr:hypothetical protein [Syntrophorhabdaceae bacterium]
VDNIGTFYDVVADMQKTLGMRGKPELTYGKRPFSLLRWLLSSAAKDMIFKSTSSPIQFLYKP